jgi:uncharacterized protein HemY
MVPNNPMFTNTLGVVLYRNGLYADTEEALLRSIKLDGGQCDAFDLFFLAMARHRLGQPELARGDFDRAVKWVAAQTDLSAQHAAELRAFRAEAEAVLSEHFADLPADVFAPDVGAGR